MAVEVTVGEMVVEAMEVEELEAEEVLGEAAASKERQGRVGRNRARLTPLEQSERMLLNHKYYCKHCNCAHDMTLCTRSMVDHESPAPCLTTVFLITNASMIALPSGLDRMGFGTDQNSAQTGSQTWLTCHIPRSVDNLSLSLGPRPVQITFIIITCTV